MTEPYGVPAWADDDYAVDIADLYLHLGIDPKLHHVRLLTQAPGGSFTHRIVPAGKVVDAATDHDRNVWSSLNLFTPGASGAVRDLRRLVAFALDLDVKDGGFATFEDAWEFVTVTATDELGAEPVAVIFSGHGLQPVWKLERPVDFGKRSAENPTAWADAYAAVGGHLQRLADEAGTRIDSAYGPERAWRVPGSLNLKDADNPIAATAWINDTLDRLTIARIREITAEAAERAAAARADRPAPVPAGPVPDGGCTYVQRMVAGWASDRWPAGERHNRMHSAAIRIAAAGRLGCLDAAGVADAERALRDVFLRSLAGARPDAEAHRELDRSLRDAREAVDSWSDEKCRADLGDHTHGSGDSTPFDVELAALTGEDTGDGTGDGTGRGGDTGDGDDDPHDPALEEDVFGYSEITRHIRAYARYALISPWTALLAELARVALLTPWYVRLPALVGGSPASLNTITAFVGESGAGKSVSTGGIGALVLEPHADDGPYMFLPGEDIGDVLTARAVGSGPAVARLYVRTEKRPHPSDPKQQITEIVQHRRSVWLAWSEVDTFLALLNHKAATISADERIKWDGGLLGATVKTEHLNLTVEPGTYRGVTTVNIQPARATEVLALRDGGFTQRVVWCSADDPNAPEEDDESEVPRLPVHLPAWHTADRQLNPPPGSDHPPVEFTVADAVRIEIRNARRAQTRRAPGALLEINAHRNLCRLKLAALIAAMHGGKHVGEDEWALAGRIMDHSDRVRGGVENLLKERTRAAYRERGVAAALAGEVEETVRSETVEKAAARVRRFLERREGSATLGEIGSFLGARHRKHRTEAVELLIRDGSVLEEQSGNVKRYRIAPGAAGDE
ncbi:hypothetical protein [Rhodococcus pyridinivorans]|uniref:hypothetical protein n=1 Tax=Rhodococcus pyridinivorans TaxID=103816 RepID=UPI00110F12D8|nr:hypothetical protein [Rhodococcus pyridinivorans]